MCRPCGGSSEGMVVCEFLVGANSIFTRSAEMIHERLPPKILRRHGFQLKDQLKLERTGICTRKTCAMSVMRI